MLERLYNLKNSGHPESQSVPQMYADMLRKFEAKCRGYIERDELNAEGNRLMAYATSAMRREVQ